MLYCHIVISVNWLLVEQSVAKVHHYLVVIQLQYGDSWVNRARVTGLQGRSRRKLDLMGDLGLVVVSRTLQMEASTRVT